MYEIVKRFVYIDFFNDILSLRFHVWYNETKFIYIDFTFPILLSRKV